MEEIYVKCCGECPYFESMVDEYEEYFGRYIAKGRCHKYNPNPTIDEEYWETRSPCFEHDFWDHQN